MFNRRYLQRNESTRFPSSVLVFDTETHPEQVRGHAGKHFHRLRLWCAKHWRFEKGKRTRCQSVSWHDTGAFWDYVYKHTSPYKPLYCFAHNIGFDLTTLRFWRELDAGNITLRQPKHWRGSKAPVGDDKERDGILCLTDPPTIIEAWIPNSRNRIIFLDTLNYWRCSLAELGDEFGIAKNPMPAFDAPREEWEVYCWQDVAILEAAVVSLEQFIREHDCGVFKYTIGSQALASFKHAHMRHKIVLHRDEYPLELEREAYRGGEVRLGFCGHIVPAGGVDRLTTADESLHNIPERSGPVHVLDCQSFYPAMMKGNSFPIELLGSVVEPGIDTLWALIQRHFIIAEVTVQTDNYTYPVKIDGRSMNACGRFRTVLCGKELFAAMERKNVKSVGRVSWYRHAPIFDRFVDYWFAQRQKAKADGKAETEMMIKTLMNSLFGKFGQRRERWRERKGKIAIRPWGTYWDWDEETNDYQFFRSVAGRVQANEHGGESAESFPAIAAAVTSYGRFHMEELRRIAGHGEWYYQDTDSLHVSSVGLERLKSANAVQDGVAGKLRLLGTYQTAEYRGIKDYTLDDVRVIAGIKKNAVEAERGVFRQLEFQKLASILSAVPNDGVMVTERTVEITHSLPPGRVLVDGTVLPPLIF